MCWRPLKWRVSNVSIGTGLNSGTVWPAPSILSVISVGGGDRGQRVAWVDSPCSLVSLRVYVVWSRLPGWAATSLMGNGLESASLAKQRRSRWLVACEAVVSGSRWRPVPRWWDVLQTL